MATVVTIGRNTKTGPLSNRAWADFRYEVKREVQVYLGDLFFEGNGQGDSDRWGEEDAYNLIAEDPTTSATWDSLLKQLAFWRGYFDQEAVAVQGFYSGGKTLFV